MTYDTVNPSALAEQASIHIGTYETSPSPQLGKVEIYHTEQADDLLLSQILTTLSQIQHVLEEGKK